MGTFITILLALALAACVVRALISVRKKGTSCCGSGCEGCTGCSGSCSCCGKAGKGA